MHTLQVSLSRLNEESKLGFLNRGVACLTRTEYRKGLPACHEKTGNCRPFQRVDSRHSAVTKYEYNYPT